MAIKVNGTTVINDSRQLQNVASVDATTVAALGAAGVGGGNLDFSTTSYSNTSVFTKPADGVHILNSYFNSINAGVYKTGIPPSQYKLLATPALTGGTIGSFNLILNPSLHSQRSGGYWGDAIIVGKQNTVTNQSMWIANIANGWTSQTSFPLNWASDSIDLEQNEQIVIWVSDVYNGGGIYNSNLQFAEGRAAISLKILTIV
jgi:hypothetical protein